MSTSRLENLKANLRYLCGFHRSVAEVCRRLEINRQQFNKYLAGANLPSDYNLRKICQFFEVGPEALFRPHKQFVAEHAGAQAAFAAGAGAAGAGFFPPPDEQVRKYCGYYDSYVASPSYPHSIIKGITRIFETSRGFASKTYERIYEVEREETYFVNKYDGMVFLYSGLLYLVEREVLNRRGYIFTVLYPSSRSPVGFMNGIVLGISGGSLRRPYGSQIVFAFQGESPDLRAMVRDCGCYGFESPAIADAVRARLLVPPAEGGFNITPPIF
ncbi:MAG TPA: helix-turn-helix transcriptional regulator [Kiloniellaceae bacterium]|nr:helix-turn-helix transcriptional regulator [Kiloniellaceae bacterium]